MKADLRTTSLCLAALLAAATPVEAGSASDFLRGLEGSWRGRGTALLPGRESRERITCQVTNRYEAASGNLTVSGQCASTQGKTQVQGRLTHKGDEVSGSIINSLGNATITSSSGKVAGGRLTVSSSLVEDATGKLIRTRQVIRSGGSRFDAAFFVYDNASGKYEPAGELSFSTK